MVKRDTCVSFEFQLVHSRSLQAEKVFFNYNLLQIREARGQQSVVCLISKVQDRGVLTSLASREKLDTVAHRSCHEEVTLAGWNRCISDTRPFARRSSQRHWNSCTEGRLHTPGMQNATVVVDRPRRDTESRGVVSSRMRFSCKLDRPIQECRCVPPTQR